VGFVGGVLDLVFFEFFPERGEDIDESAQRGDRAGDELDFEGVAAQVDDGGGGGPVAGDGDCDGGVGVEFVADEDAVVAFVDAVVVGHDGSPVAM
jgi:hypothetical protein